MTVLCARDDVFVTHNQDTDEAYGFSLKTGAQLWGPVALKGNAISTLMRGADIAYGRVYIYDFGGYVNALNAHNRTTTLDIHTPKRRLQLTLRSRSNLELRNTQHR